MVIKDYCVRQIVRKHAPVNQRLKIPYKLNMRNVNECLGTL